MLIELSARCYGWGATSEYRFKIGYFAPTGAGWPNISGRRGRRPTNHFYSQKTRLNERPYGIKIWTDLSLVLSQCTRLTDRRTDRQTDRQTDRIIIARPHLHSMQRGKMVLLNNVLKLCQKLMKSDRSCRLINVPHCNSFLTYWLDN